MTLADTFAQIASAATALDLPALRATIHETIDNGLRAARFDGAGGRSAEFNTHPDRALAQKHPGQFPKDTDGDVDTKRGSWGGGTDPGFADLDRITDLEIRFTSAIYELATRSHSGPFPQDWRGAVIGARRLHTMDAIATLDRTGLRPARWVHLAGDSVHDLEIIARRHITGRKPTEDEKNWQRTNPNDVCAWHQAIHDRHRRQRLPGKNVCQVCADLAILLGQKPPRWLLEAEIDLRESRPVAWRAALSRCMDELGVVRDRSA